MATQGNKSKPARLPVDYQMRLYGSNKKLHIQLRLSVPAQKNHFERIEEVKSLAPIIWQDFKHSGPWDCEFCGKPARETLYIDQPLWRPDCLLFNKYVHFLCATTKGPCLDAYNELTTKPNHTGAPPMLIPIFPDENNPNGDAYPLAASCLGCREDPTGDQTLQVCSRCKVVRYCSIPCQADDWIRHKRFCKLVVDRQWENPKDDPSND